MKEEVLDRCQELLGYTFRDRDLLEKALTHPSFATSRSMSYERLEFLGDSVLGLSVCSILYSDYDELQEGEMTRIKSTVVSRKTCSVIAREIGLDGMLFLGEDMSTEPGIPDSVTAATFESIIGAIFVDGGFEPANKFIAEHTRHRIQDALDNLHRQNCKSILQQYAQKHNMPPPDYVLLDEKGPDHSKCFEIAVSLGNNHFESAWGMNKKEAEQEAARLALVALGILEFEEEQAEESTDSMPDQPAEGNID